VADPTKPALSTPADGFISGVFTTPPSCAGVSYRACKGCLASNNPQGCLACAKSKAETGLREVLATTPQGSVVSKMDQCVACYTNSADPKK